MSQNFIKQGDETLTLNLGGIVNQFDTTLRLDGQTSRGSTINLETNGLKKNLSSLEAGGTWRFWSRNRIDVRYFSAKRSGSHTTDREANIDGVVIPANSTLTLQATSQFVLMDYRFSFIKNDHLELAGLLGIYGGEFKYQLTATQAGGGQSPLLDRTASTTVPLPLIGLTVDWYINPRWKVSASAAGVKARIGDADGSAFIGGVSTEFMLVRNFGLGLAYMYSDLNLDVTKNSFNGNLGWKMNSVALYGQLKL